MANIIEILPDDPFSWIITLTIAAITFYLAKFYYKVLSLPPGPLPLPLLGNILSLRGTKHHFAFELIKLHEKYGPILTFWFGPKPFVYIFDLEFARDSFKRNEFSGRPQSHFTSLISNEKYSDVIFADYGPEWESLRRVAHSAVRKYSVSDKLSYLVCDIIDDTVKEIKEKNAINKAFDPSTMIYQIFLNILASSAFGKRYSVDDAEFKNLKYWMNTFFKENGDKVILAEFIPILRPLYWSFNRKLQYALKYITDIEKEHYLKHVNDYEDGIIRDFCDSLICAKIEALKENKESAPFLKDESLSMVIHDLFFAGTDTSQNTFKWIMLLLANYPEMQNKMRDEISSVIGDRIAVYDDRNQCHYVNAFIAEAMRLKPVAPFGAFHKNLIETKIGEQKIPAETTLFIHQLSILRDPKYWTDPEAFNPNRFLENGIFVSQRQSAFIPFGTGRRVCLGEKMAIIDLFYVLVRFLQATDGHEISLEDGPGSGDLEPDLKVVDMFTPKQYKILLKKL